MTNRLRLFIALGLPLAFFVSSCATSQISSVWKDPDYAGHPEKIMVIGVSKSAMNRRIFEDEFVRQLQARGVEAVASYTVLPDRKQDDQAAIAARVMEQQADTVLITRLVSKKKVQVYVPGTAYYPPSHYGRWRDYYGYGYQAIYSPGYMTEDEYALIETNLYDAVSDKLIWAASSETGIRGSDRKLIHSFIGTMVNAMSENNLLGK